MVELAPMDEWQFIDLNEDYRIWLPKVHELIIYKIIRKVRFCNLQEVQRWFYSPVQLTSLASQGRRSSSKCSNTENPYESKLRSSGWRILPSKLTAMPRLLPSLAFRWSNAWSSQTDLYRTVVQAEELQIAEACGFDVILQDLCLQLSNLSVYQ